MSYLDGTHVIEHAKRRLDAPYLFGGKPVKGSNYKTPTDCSGLVAVAFRECGLAIVDGSANQRAECRTCTIAQAGNIPGALLFWRESKSAPISHVGISTGQGNVIEANGYHGKVIVRPLAAGKWCFAGLPKVIYG